MATTRNRSAWVWLALAALAFAVAFLSLPKASTHAVEKRGIARLQRIEVRFRNVDPDDDDVWENVCPDGRRYTIRQLPEGDAWDVSIDDAAGRFNITRFTTRNADWVARKLAWCE